MAAKYQLLDVLLIPALFAFRQINTRQGRIEEELVERGWPRAINLPEWRWRKAVSR
jgi:hypothetical protein